MLDLLDANILIDANRDYYPMDRVPEFWDWLAAMGQQGLVKVPREVYDKVTQADDALSRWLKEHREALLLDETVDGDLIRRVISEGYAPDLNDVEIEQLNEDPFWSHTPWQTLGSAEWSLPSVLGPGQRAPIARFLTCAVISASHATTRSDSFGNWTSELTGARSSSILA